MMFLRNFILRLKNLIKSKRLEKLQMNNDFNPFLKPGIVTEKDMWDSNFSDFDELNSYVFQQVIKSLRQVKGAFSIAITGEVGSGKSHLYSRIHHQLSKNNEAFCIRINADKITSLDCINYYFLQFLIDGLSHPRESGITYLQEIATAIVNKSLEGIESIRSLKKPQELLEIFDSIAKKKGAVEKITKKIQQLKPYLIDSSNVIRALLWTLSAPSQKEVLNHNEYLFPTAVNWLKGIEIPEEDAKIMKLPSRNFTEDDKDRESQALNQALQLIRIISDNKSLVICFDELDSINVSQFAFTVPEVIPYFIKTLHNNLDKVSCKNSILLLSLWLPLTWKYKLENHKDSSIQDRVCSLPSLRKQPLSLEKFLNEETALKLVAFWIKSLTDSQSSNPYHPFAENDIREFAKKNNPTPRDLRQWCAANWSSIEPPPPEEILKQMYERFQTEEDFRLMNDDASIVNALLFGFEQILGKTVENVQIQKIIKQPQSAKFQFKIEGLEDNQKISIGVGVCQSPLAVTVGAMLTRLIDYPRFKLTRGCLVRSEDKKIKNKAKAFQNMEKLVSPPLNGEVVDLKYKEIKQLYDLQQVVKEVAKKIDIDPNIVLKFVKEKILKNQLIQEILSDPSGDIANMASTTSISIIPTSSDPYSDLSEEDFDIDEEFDEEKFISVIKDLIIDVYNEPIALISYYPEEGAVTGLFLEFERNWIFDYRINYDPTSVVYRPHKFIAELPDEKMEILPKLEGQEIIALIDLIRFSESFGGSVTILTDDDFEDEDLALEKYQFYPTEEGLAPILYYASNSLSNDNETVAIGAYLFWDDDDNESLSNVFVYDHIDVCMSNFESIDEAIEYASTRIIYYLEES